VGNEKFTINDRRVAAWTELLFRLTVYHTGNNSFGSIPQEALRMLRYAYPMRDEKEAAKWESVAMSIVDAVGIAIEQYMAIARGKFQIVAKSNAKDKSALIAELGRVLAESEEELTRLGGSDKRVDEALTQFNKWFRQASSGKAIK
jgi:hypothetical protein